VVADIVFYESGRFLIFLTRAHKLKVLLNVSGHRVPCKEEPTNNEAFWQEYVPRR
jgi:hypothetical protein